MLGVKIALIDDSRSSSLFLANALRAFEFEVEVYADPEQALAAIPTLNCDCILTDYEMPKMKGPELIRKLKSNPATKDIPVIILSAHDTDEKIIEAVVAGAEDYMLKRTNPEVMLAKIRVFIELKKHRESMMSFERVRTYNAVVTSLNHEFNNAGAIALNLLDKIDQGVSLKTDDNKAELARLRTMLERILRTIKEFSSRDAVEFQKYSNSIETLMLAPKPSK
jgi:DNA-binding response OmpR family regulator